MAKVFRMDFPPEYEPLLKKILAWFDSLQYPTWATRFFHTTRSAKKRLKEKTQIPRAKEYWASLSSDEKNLWKQARSITYWSSPDKTIKKVLSGYQTFLSDFSHRKKLNLSLPGTPSLSHQVCGLKISNPAAENGVEAHLHLKDLISPVNFEVYYKKVEVESSQSAKFIVKLQGFYFDGGLNIEKNAIFEAPPGNVDWSKISLSLPEISVPYFHLIIYFQLNNYNADVYLDNLKISDKDRVVYQESFHRSPNGLWDFAPFYRKRGWAFYPSVDFPYYDVVYLDS